MIKSGTTSKVIEYCILILLISSIVIAQEDDYYDDVDWINDHLETADYSRIEDWSQIQWYRIPPSRIKDVPADQLNYNQLFPKQRKQMTIEQIEENFDKIEDLTKDVNRESGIEAIKQKYGVIVDLGNGANLKNGVLQATYGQRGNVPLSSVSKTTLVKVDEEGRVLLIGERKPPLKGDYVAVYDDQTEIETPEGIYVNVQGKLSYIDGQAYVEAGNSVIYNTYKIDLSTVSNDAYVFSEPISDESIYNNRPFVVISDEKIVIHSTPKTKINLEVMAGNKLFNTFKKQYEKDEEGNLIRFKTSDEENGFSEDFYGFKYKLIPDEKDLLRITVQDGDMITAEDGTEEIGSLFSNKEKEKIPKMVHNSIEGGKTVIQNGRSGLIFTDKLALSLEKFSNQEEFDKLHYGRFQSVAFEIESSVIGYSNEIRFGSNNHFAFVNPTKEDVPVIYNKWGIGISEYKDEQIQTLEELQAKWYGRGIDLGIMNGGFVTVTSERYKEPSPFILQTVDQWLEMHPGAQMDFIYFSDDDNAAFTSLNFGEKTGIYLGERIFDPLSTPYMFRHYATSELNKPGSRNLESPLSIITHEYEHYMDGDIRNKDSKIIEEIIGEIEDSKDHRWEEALDYARKNIDLDDFEDVTLFELGVIKMDQEFLNLKNEQIRYYDEHDWEEFRNRYSKSYLENEEDVESYIQMLKDDILSHEIAEKYSQRLDELINQNEKDPYSQVMKELLQNENYAAFLKPRISSTKEWMGARRYLGEKLTTSQETMPLDEIYNEIVNQQESKLMEDPTFNKLVSKAMTDVVQLVKENKETLTPIQLDSALKLLEEYNKNNGLISLEKIARFKQFAEENEVLEQNYREIVDYVENEGGIPALYASRDYGKRDDYLRILLFNLEGKHELSSTYREEPIAERRFKIHQGTPAQQEVYAELTQTAFDSGKMDVDEFKQLMGDDYCQNTDCSDKKCCVYKLNCVGSCT